MDDFYSYTADSVAAVLLEYYADTRYGSSQTDALLRVEALSDMEGALVKLKAISARAYGAAMAYAAGYSEAEMAVLYKVPEPLVMEYLDTIFAVLADFLNGKDED